MAKGKDESHNSLCHKKCIEKLATSTSHIEPKNLPPTAAAAKFHSYRIFLQICQWKDLACDLEPSLWGWAQTVGGLFPITTDLPPAPEDLLKIIRCNCTTDCSSGRCSCQKHGMKCSLACGQCRGSACSNASPIIAQEEEDLLEEYTQ